MKEQIKTKLIRKAKEEYPDWDAEKLYERYEHFMEICEAAGWQCSTEDAWNLAVSEAKNKERSK